MSQEGAPMRFITDCTDCGSVVVPATDLGLVRQPTGDFHGVFECPVCDDAQTVAVARAAAPALVARGAEVVTEQPERSPLTVDDLAQLQELLADDDACRQFLEEAH